MARHPALQVFRRFSDLNLKCLLYYQAELARLKEDLEKAEEEDAKAEEMPRKLYGTSWLALTSDIDSGSTHVQSSTSSKSVSHTNIAASQKNTRQWDIVCHIRVVLEAYYQALQRQVEIDRNHPEPRAADLVSFREWHKDGRFGKGFLLGTVEDVWDTEQKNGLRTSEFLTPADTGDSLSYSMTGLFLQMRTTLLKMINASVTWCWQLSRCIHATSRNLHSPDNDEAERQTSIEEIQSLTAGQINRVSAGIVTVLASMLLVMPILVLYLVDSMATKVGLVFVFTVLMSAVTTFGLYMNAEKVLTITSA